MLAAAQVTEAAPPFRVVVANLVDFLDGLWLHLADVLAAAVVAVAAAAGNAKKKADTINTSAHRRT